MQEHNDLNQDLPDFLCLNEETLKSRYLVPLLERLGLHRQDLRFEETFSLKIGRQTVTESVSVALVEKRPRLDILVTRDGRNLFVIEAKRPNVQLSEEDGLQAISYARLVHPVAPYAIVTNGRKTILYRTLTREVVKASEVELRGGYELSLPTEDDFDALDCFLRLSTENLLRFCRAQVSSSMRALLGSLENLNRKYIPEVHLPRAKVGRALEGLGASDKTTLALVGPSGTGKTSSMCHRAIEFLERGRPALFFSRCGARSAACRPNSR